jgi:hypothetical protein
LQRVQPAEDVGNGEEGGGEKEIRDHEDEEGMRVGGWIPRGEIRFSGLTLPIRRAVRHRTEADCGVGAGPTTAGRREESIRC